MDFTLPPAIEEARRRARQFVEDEVLPVENDPANYDDHENITLAALRPLRAKAKAAGLWAPQMPTERGGMGLPTIGMAAVYEEMNRSIFGPVAINCAAPDDGNMFVLNRIGTEEQKTKWLQPIIDGDIHSSFVMTEPHPGSGSDPSMMLTKAEPIGNSKWRITGRKWYITGAESATHFILMARTSDDALRPDRLHVPQGPTGLAYRAADPIGAEEHGGHCDLEFDGLEIDDSDRR